MSAATTTCTTLPEGVTYYKVAELARFLRRSRQSIVNMAHSGALPGGFQVGGRWLFRADLVRQFLRENGGLP
jgi:excisionase family DNA binding protein